MYSWKPDVITLCHFSLAGILFYKANSACPFVQIIQFFNKTNECIRMGITAFKIVIWGVVVYFTKFQTVKPPVYDNFKYSYPLSGHTYKENNFDMEIFVSCRIGSYS